MNTSKTYIHRHTNMYRLAPHVLIHMYMAYMYTFYKRALIHHRQNNSPNVMYMYISH